MAKHGFPSLARLGAELVTVDQLKDMGWSAAGGAAGFVGASFAMPLLDKLPIFNRLPAEVRQGLLAVVGARLAWGWNRDFAKGIAGGLGGHALARGLMRVAGQTMNLALVPGAPGDEEFAQLPSPSMPVESTETDVVVDESELAEVEAEQDFGANVEPEASISSVGSWIS